MFELTFVFSQDANGSIGLTMDGLQKKPVEMLPTYVVTKIASGGDHLVMLTVEGDIYTSGRKDRLLYLDL